MEIAEVAEKITRLKELSALIRSVGDHVRDDFVYRFMVELLDGHIGNMERGDLWSKK